jgi:hypothetical protein
MDDRDDTPLSDDDIARRRDDAIRRALNTPPTPHKQMVGRSAKQRRLRPVDKDKEQP